MDKRGQNEGLRVLDDFVCEAIHNPAVPQALPTKQGQNEGMRILEGSVQGSGLLVDSDLVGNWMASTYLSDGVRIDHALTLQPDGSFVWRTRREGQGDHTSRGAWRHNQGEEVLYFTPSEAGPVYGPNRPQLWRVLQIVGLEGANAFMVLRWAALASRNLPVLFFRVHLGSAETDATADSACV
ncbi:MAG TPA: hypothetical protein VMF69_22405 [Gemmataceae bacterium]|nr:hypothetical protein [Gemmataceae bacterium]